MFPFLVFRERGLIKSCSSPEDPSEYKISWSYVDRCKFYIHLKSLIVRHFGMVADTALKLQLPGHLQWINLRTEFHKNLPIVQNCLLGCTRMKDDIWMMDCKGSGRNRSWPNLRHCPHICLEGLKKPRRSSIRITSLRVQVWIRDLPNTKQECWPLDQGVRYSIVSCRRHIRSMTQ
jgi:hypothetical protein